MQMLEPSSFGAFSDLNRATDSARNGVPLSRYLHRKLPAVPDKISQGREAVHFQHSSIVHEARVFEWGPMPLFEDMKFFVMKSRSICWGDALTLEI